jgi:hypothetical protein
MAAEAEHVRARPQPQRRQPRVAAQLPRGADELGHVRRQLQPPQVVLGQASVQGGGEALGGLGGVLGDLAGHQLSRKLLGLVITAGDVAHVELLAPPRIPARSIIEGWAGHPPSGHGLPQGPLEEDSGEGLGWWGQAAGAAAFGGGVQAQDGVEVDRAAALELGDLWRRRRGPAAAALG